MKKTDKKQSKPAGEKTALLVIDVQLGLFQRPTPLYQADLVLRNINTLIDHARQAGVQVVFIQHSNDNLLIKGTPQWQLHPQIQPLSDEPIIHKLKGNAFLDTNLAELLAEKQVGQLVLCGLVTHGCVMSTCLGALELGYRVTLVTDGHSNLSPDAPRLIREWNRKLGRAGAELKMTEDVKF
jgi:nicotinamidase-related amidase